MGLAYQRFTHFSVKRTGTDISLDISFIDSNREDILSLLLDSQDFTVKAAQCETPRNPGGFMGLRDLNALRGQKVYLQGAKGIKESLMALESEEREHFYNLLLGGISTVVQAEVFLLTERGFATPGDYEDFFQKAYQNGCVFYSNLGRVERDFTAYVEENHKGRGRGSLFNRQNLVTVRKAPMEDRFLVRGNLCDSFHEIAMKIMVDFDFNILAVRSSMLRFPDPVCKEAMSTFNSLVGKRMVPENTSQLLSCSHGNSGCAHLGDLVIEGARALKKL